MGEIFGIPPISQWFADTASLSVVTAALVSSLRKHLLKDVDGLGVVGLSGAVGIGLSYLGQALGYQLPEHPFLYGASAGLLASGAVDLLKKLALGTPGSAQTDRSKLE